MNQIQTYNIVDAALMEEWLKLWKKSPLAHPFNSPMWYRASVNSYRYEKQLIVTVRNKKKLVAILPLVETKMFGVKTYAFPAGKYADMSCLLMADNDKKVMRSIITFLARTETFYLQEVNDEMTESLRRNPHRLAIRKTSENPYIPLGNDPFRYMSKNSFYKLTRKAIRYQDSLRYHTYWGDTGGLSLAFEIDAKSTKKKAGKAAFSDEQSRDFFISLALEFKELFHFDVLFFEEIPMVYSIGFIHNGIYYGVNTAFDLNLKHIIPGKMMLYYLLNKLKYEDVRMFYFSRGVNELKKQFTPHSYTQYDVFYSKQPIKQMWWRGMNNIAETILNSKTLYKAYKKAQMAARLT